MNANLLDYVIEPERYEFFESPLPELDRRDFFRIAGAGLVVALLWRNEALAQRPRPGGTSELSAWLHVGEDSAITVYCGKVEIGQNIRTSLSQVVAEEMRVPVSRIKMVMSDTALVPFDAGTFGSQTTPQMASQLRRAGAAAREVLLDMAAEQGSLERDKLEIKDGKIVGPDGKSFAFGELTKGKKFVKTVGQNVPTTPPEKWTVEGTSVAKVDGAAIVTGAHRYASDIKRPGMLFGKILRPPALKATLASVKTDEAEKLPGITVIHEGSFVGVVGPTEHAAAQALAKLQAEWKTPAAPTNSDEVYKYFKDHPGGKGGGGFGGFGKNSQGNVKEGLKAADAKVETSFNIAYIAHVPLEPRAAVAEWEGDKLTVWTGTQRPFGVRSDLTNAFGITADKVRVIVPDTGSGYGGKHNVEAAIEAARLAKAVKKPVKVVWTREEEFTWAYCRPGGVIDVVAGAKKDGTLTAWEFHNWNSGGAGLRNYYEVPNLHTEFHSCDSPLRQGSYRALAATANHFAREMVMDELAKALKIDPVEFRLKNLKNDRLKTVLQAAAKQFGWGKGALEDGHGVGIALGTEKGSYVATAVEVSVDEQSGRVRVLRAVTAFDCGPVLNPDHLKNQIEGAVVMGIGGALFEALKFADGKITNPHFADYRLPRFVDAPHQEVVLIDRKDVASAGAGETPIVCIAPAIGNAICNATGVRLRSMPMVPDGLKKG
jgi:isoquinoline 1-oxidoreductase